MSLRALVPALLGVLAAAGCRQDMHDQPRYEPFERSAFFGDGRASRPWPPGTVARGELVVDEHLQTGRVDGELADTYPFPITREVLLRGRERYGIFCAPCHDRTGSGRGMIVQRGMKRPTSFHAERLREAAPGYHFDVITNGFGVMYDYADRMPPEDRWAVVAWVQTLQRGQTAQLAELPASAREAFEREVQGGTR